MLTILCLGKNGAANVFGPQKGATSEMVPELEKGLKNWSEVIEKSSGKNWQKLKAQEQQVEWPFR